MQLDRREGPHRGRAHRRRRTRAAAPRRSRCRRPRRPEDPAPRRWSPLRSAARRGGVGVVDAERQRRAQSRVVARVGEKAREHVVPRGRANADREVDGRAAERLGGVDPSARQVEHVAGLEHRVDRGRRPGARRDRVAVVGPRLVGERMPVHGLVDPPVLRARDLDHEHVVRVVVRIEPARGRRGDVGVDLRGVTQIGDELPGECGDRLPTCGAVPAGPAWRRPANCSSTFVGIELVADLGAEAARRGEQRRRVAPCPPPPCARTACAAHGRRPARRRRRSLNRSVEAGRGVRRAGASRPSGRERTAMPGCR